MRGASAAQEFLNRHSEQKALVLVVWEPMLATDWRPPSGSTMGRIPDKRARQFWDPNHTVAGALNDLVKHKPPQLEPTCCFDRGFYWDDAILYALHQEWKDAPASVFWDGPVVRIIPGLEKRFDEQKTTPVEPLR